MFTVVLKPGRDKSLRRRHPWVFSGAIRTIEGTPAPGETVAVKTHDGQFLATGAYSPHSQIAVRIWTWDRDETVDEAFMERRMARAVAGRASITAATAYRLVYAESDGLPGLIVDRYGDSLVLQSLSAGSEYWKATLVSALAKLVQPRGIYERSDVDVRQKEGLSLATGTVHGDTIPERVEVVESGRRYQVDVRRGHKTGFYLDQRENRDRLAGYAAGRQVLDCFAYTGGFTVAALSGGASHVTSVDSSAEAMAAGRDNVRLNGLPPERSEWIEADVFDTLRMFRDTGRRFDLIVLDPPKFAHSAGQVERAARGYKDINWLAFRLLRPGGELFTFSCSGAVGSDLFQKIVAGAALDAGVEAQVVGRLTQASDHPVMLQFPEGAYLKGLHCRLLG